MRVEMWTACALLVAGAFAVPYWSIQLPAQFGFDWWRKVPLCWAVALGAAPPVRISSSSVSSVSLAESARLHYCRNVRRSSVRVLVFPYANRHPTSCGQALVGVAVAGRVGSELRDPPLLIGLRRGCM